MPDRGPACGRPHGTPVHASAVAIDDQGLLIVGPSGSGKSHLAAALVAASTRSRAVRLIGDDRILLTTGTDGLTARPHPRIAGFLERRGLGIVAVSFAETAPVTGLVNLGLTTLPDILAQNLDTLFAVYTAERSARPTCDSVLAWWRGARTTPRAKAPGGLLADAKD